MDIMQAQATRAARQAVADDIITNESDLGVLESQVEELHNLYNQVYNLRKCDKIDRKKLTAHSLKYSWDTCFVNSFSFLLE
jgi:hypothetical protein